MLRNFLSYCYYQYFSKKWFKNFYRVGTINILLEQFKKYLKNFFKIYKDKLFDT